MIDPWLPAAQGLSASILPSSPALIHMCLLSEPFLSSTCLAQ